MFCIKIKISIQLTQETGSSWVGFSNPVGPVGFGPEKFRYKVDASTVVIIIMKYERIKF
jgi:hypothetical protein